jgi:Carboxypeptidase regulatory-like domain
MKRLPVLASWIHALFLTVVLLWSLPAWSVAPTQGGILGQVRDVESGSPVGGVTVVASGPEGDVATLTDASGNYQFRALPVGNYTIRFHRNDVLAERGATISVDKILRINMRLPAVPSAVETIAAPEAPPAIDVGSSRIGTTFGREFIDGIPNAGADVASLMQKTAGAYEETPTGYQGNPGVSLSGGTGADNSYYLEGLNVTSLRDGLLGTNLHVAFLEEAEVVSAGYGAEYGRALGGVVNMALKSGTNTWKGSAFTWVAPGWLAGSPKRILSASTVLTGTTEPDYTTQMGVEVGGPILKDKLFIWVGYVPEIARSSLVQHADRYVDRNGDGSPDTNPDGSPMVEPLYSRVIPGESTTHNYAGKLTWRLTPEQTLSLSLVGIRKDQEYMQGANMDLLAGMTRNQVSRQDIIAHWQSAFFQRHWRLDATLGLHTEGYSQHSPYGDAESTSSITWNGSPSLAQFEPIVGGICAPRPGEDPSFNACPVTGYQSGGYGTMHDVSAFRVAGQIKSTNIFSAMGLHELKYGIDYEFNQYDDKVAYSGLDGARGMVFVHPDQTFNAYTLDRDGYQDFIHSKTRAFNNGAFIQESYLPRPNWTINLGLRWEAQRFTDYMGNTALSITDSFAPRIGVVYDPTNEGRAKIFAHYGQYYESIPMDFSQRAFGGQGGYAYSYPASCSPSTPGACDPRLVDSFSITAPRLLVQSNIKGSYNNEIVLGGQYQHWRDFVFGASIIRRWLGRVIEDTGGDLTDGSGPTLLANPSNPKPERTYTALQLTANKRMARNWFFAGSYTLSRLEGNYTGLYDADNGQLNPNGSTQFDVSQLMANRNGPLPNDRTHIIHLDGYYRFNWTRHAFSPGLSFVGYSGTPITPFGSAPFEGPNETFIYPRGSAGRTPFVTRLDLHLSYRTKLSQTLSAEAFFDIFNLLNRHTVLTVDSTYTYDQVMPTSKTTPLSSLPIADDNGKNTSATATPNANYLHATSYQAPINGRLGARIWF